MPPPVSAPVTVSGQTISSSFLDRLDHFQQLMGRKEQEFNDVQQQHAQNTVLVADMMEKVKENTKQKSQLQRDVSALTFDRIVLHECIVAFDDKFEAQFRLAKKAEALTQVEEKHICDEVAQYDEVIMKFQDTAKLSEAAMAETKIGKQLATACSALKAFSFDEKMMACASQVEFAEKELRRAEEERDATLRRIACLKKDRQNIHAKLTQSKDNVGYIQLASTDRRTSHAQNVEKLKVKLQSLLKKNTALAKKAARLEKEL